jgi:phenylpropionate dioxygenase-like ring-hydroxylating dioxygenase large terminal subunit
MPADEIGISRATTRPRGAAELVGPPRERFTDPAWHRRDLEAAFLPEWHLVAHSSELRNPGDFTTFSLGYNEVVVVRKRDGALRAYHNFCRHRGHRLVTSETDRIGRNIVCRYHGWAFDTGSGSCVHAPRMHSSFEPRDWPLIAVSVEEAHGFVFVCLSDNPPPSIAASMSTVGFGGYDPDRMTLAFRDSYVVQANWKTVVENNVECYHCALNHPELCSAYDPWSNFVDEDSFNEGKALSGEFASIHGVAAREVPDQRLTIDGKQICQLDLPRKYGRPEDAFEMWWNPGYYIVLARDLGFVFTVKPVDENACMKTDFYLVHEDARAGTHYDLDELTRFWSSTMREDNALTAEVHRGMQMPRYVPGPLNKHYQTGQIAFYSWYEERIKQLDQSTE